MGDPKELVRYIESRRNIMVIEITEEPTTITAATESVDDMLEKQDDFHLTVVPAVAAEYTDTFDKRFNSIIETLAAQMGHHSSRLRLVLIHLLEEFTLKTLDVFLGLVGDVVEIGGTKYRTDIAFEHLLILVYNYLFEQFSKQENYRNLNNYIMSLSDEKNQNISDINGYLNGQSTESIEQLMKQCDIEHTYSTELCENRKMYLAIEARVDEISSDFQLCCTTASRNELAETIKDIVKRLSTGSATVFFALAKRLLDDHAMNVQLSLGRFISIDIFMTDIYCLLQRISAENEFESLNEYLFQYTDDLYEHIEIEFKLNYVQGIDTSLKRTACNICAGEVFV